MWYLSTLCVEYYDRKEQNSRSEKPLFKGLTPVTFSLFLSYPHINCTFFFFFGPHHAAAWHRISISTPRSEYGHQQWKHGLLTTRPTWNSLLVVLLGKPKETHTLRNCVRKTLHLQPERFRLDFHSDLDNYLHAVWPMSLNFYELVSSPTTWKTSTSH